MGIWKNTIQMVILIAILTLIAIAILRILIVILIAILMILIAILMILIAILMTLIAILKTRIKSLTKLPMMSLLTNLVAKQTMIRTGTLKVTLLIVAAILTATPPTLMALITTMEMNMSTATNGIHMRSMFTIMTGHILHDRAVYLFVVKLYLLNVVHDENSV